MRLTEFNDSFMATVGGIGNQDTKLGSSILGGESNTITGGTADTIAGGSSESLSGVTNYLTQAGSSNFAP